MQICPGEVISFFREQKGAFKTRYGVLMKMLKDQESFYANHQLPEWVE
jgi:hypothetical protein